MDRFDTVIGKCAECGHEGDLMPLGDNGKNVCGRCGMKDPKAAAKRFFDLMMKGE